MQALYFIPHPFQFLTSQAKPPYIQIPWPRKASCWMIVKNVIIFYLSTCQSGNRRFLNLNLSVILVIGWHNHRCWLQNLLLDASAKPPSNRTIASCCNHHQCIKNRIHRKFPCIQMDAQTPVSQQTRLFENPTVKCYLANQTITPTSLIKQILIQNFYHCFHHPM